MLSKRISIEGIPAIIWGRESEKVYVHVHGKMSRKEYAERFAELAEIKGWQTLSFDLPEHGERTGDTSRRCDVWNGMRDLKSIADYAFSRWREVSLFACSLGAYFSLNAYSDKPFVKCLFQSPMLDMEHMIRKMCEWFGVTERRLQAEGEVATPIDPLRWDYYQYVLSHPITKWAIPTEILYAGKDSFQTLEIMQSFAKRFGCGLTVSEGSEHPFMAPEDAGIVAEWLQKHI